MAKHRELANVIFASALGRASSSKIWRTVVVAGAMLGTPALALAKEAPAKEERRAEPPAESLDEAKARLAELQKQAKELNAAITAQTKAVQAAKSDDERAAAKAKLEELKTQKKELDLKIRAARAEVAKLTPKRPRGNDDRPTGRGFILS